MIAHSLSTPTRRRARSVARLLAPAVLLALAGLVGSQTHGAASVAPTPTPPPPDLTVSGPSELWLSPAGQATLPDPTKPLCAFTWTITWQQSGYDRDGYDTYLFSNWGSGLSCQLRTRRLEITFDVFEPKDHQYVHPWASARASCESACSTPIADQLPSINCSPCHQFGWPFTAGGQQYQNQAYDLRLWYTVTFEKPLVFNTYEWATNGEQVTGDQFCGNNSDELLTAVGLANGRGTDYMYSHSCEMEFLLGIWHTAKDGPDNWTCDQTSAGCRRVAPLNPAARPTRIASPARPAPTSLASAVTALPMTAAPRTCTTAAGFATLALPLGVVLARWRRKQRGQARARFARARPIPVRGAGLTDRRRRV